MGKNGSFADFDDESVYNDSQESALNEETLNFVVEFGKENAQIAFDLSLDQVESLYDASRELERPVRWINIWAPNRQTEIIDLLGRQYKFSPRLLAIIKSMGPDLPSPTQDDKHVGGFEKMFHNDDVELATSSTDTPRASPPSQPRHNISQYDIAKQMINYHSIDIGTHFLCIGANWMHKLQSLKVADTLKNEGSQRRLWSWLVLCDDNTVISLHEDTGLVNNVEDLKSMRGNTLSVMSQLSSFGHLSADPTSMQTVRQALELDSAQANPGIEGASNLFYYLFDDWRAVYSTIAAFRHRLEHLQTEIFEDMTRKSGKPPNIEIIPKLHLMGRQIREMQGLYQGYENLIQRIMEPKSTSAHGAVSPTRSFSGLGAGERGVVLAQSARQRFERLGDRLKLLILSGTGEFLAEKEALISTYFNINTQKDSEATARLTRSATLLAKLSVLFLPVSLMTSYFSVQISDLEGVYTVKDYWIVFAVIMSISFICLFFFSRLLMWITETLDAKVKDFNRWCGSWFTKSGRQRRRQTQSSGDKR